MIGFRRTLPFICLACVAVAHGVEQRPDDAMPQSGQPPTSLDNLLGPAVFNDAAGPSGQPPGNRGPATAPPSPEAVKAAVKQVWEAFRDELTSAEDPTLRKQLVMSLIKAADDPGIGDAQRWSALEIAIQVAAEGADPDLLREALEARNAWFTGQDSLGPMGAFLRSAHGLSRGDPTRFLEAALRVNRDALDACRADVDRLSLAQEVIVFADEEMIRKLPANDQDRLRASVRAQRAETDEVAAICDAAAEGRQMLLNQPENAAAKTILGFHSAWAGDWDTAVTHLLKSTDRQFRAAAEAEFNFRAKRLPAEAFKVAGLWWESVQDEEDAAVLDPRPDPRPSPLIRREIKQHAAKLYKDSLPSLDTLIQQKLAATRIAEASKLFAAKPLPQRRPRAPAIAFDAARFEAAEAKRAKLFGDLANALQKRDQRRVAEIQNELSVVRREWAGALHLYNRDMALPERQARINEILRGSPAFGDGWLCDCFLKMLAGDRDAAAVSFGKAVNLMTQGPGQVFAGQQYLDAAEAALALGKIEDATKLRNALQKKFPNDLGVKFLAARIAVQKKLFTDANDTFVNLMKQQDVHPVIVAEYAWFKAGNPVNRLRDVQEAECAIDRVLAANQGPLWKALRARAAVQAAAGRWDQAIETLDESERQSPLLFADEFRTQREAYVEREEYFFGR